MSDSETIAELLAGINDREAVFIDADALALQIIDQNARYQESDRVFASEPDILEMVKFGIAEEQEETFANILALQPESNRAFEALGKAGLSIENGIAKADQDLETIDVQINNNERTIKQQQEHQALRIQAAKDEIMKKVEQLAPRAVDMVDEYLQSKNPASITVNEIDMLEDEVINLMDQKDEIESEREKIRAYSEPVEAIMGRVALAWEMPIALIDQGYEKFAIFDEIPVEPKDESSQPEGVKRFAERHIDQPQAALYTALFLCEHSGQVVDVEQIANALYSPDVIKSTSEHRLRARVTTTLGPLVKGENLRTILDEEDHVLQYGWRKKLAEKDGHLKTVSRTRIYRAIRKDQIDMFRDQTKIEGDGFEIELEGLPFCDEAIEQEPLIEVDDTAIIETPAATPSNDHPEIHAEIKAEAQQERSHETNSQRKERQKNELLKAITGPAHAIIKRMGEHGIIERGDTDLLHLRYVSPGIEMGDDDIRRIISSRITPHEGLRLKCVDAVRLLVALSHEDETVRAAVSSKQWRAVVNEKIDELVKRELRGIERRKKRGLIWSYL